MQLVSSHYVNAKEQKLINEFLSSNNRKKYILGINAFTKSVQKHIQIEGIIDDFTRVQSSRKKSVLTIDEVPQDALILCAAFGSPLSVADELNKRGFEHFNYVALYKYSNLELKAPPFWADFELDFKNNQDAYEKVYYSLADEKSKETFEKVINFKISADLTFMEGFTNNHEEQYFDKTLIESKDDIIFVDGGAYVGDTLPQIMNYFPNFKKIYAIEPNEVHINIAKRDFGKYDNIEFINCGLGKEKIEQQENNQKMYHGEHDYQAQNINTIDNLIHEKVDFIKLDIEGAEQDALWGAKQTIQYYSPILAVCIYHKANDWYKVPQIVKQINSNYDIYLRHYMEGIYETVMYFIPKKSSFNKSLR